jgi:hypothetical protein
MIYHGATETGSLYSHQGQRFLPGESRSGHPERQIRLSTPGECSSGHSRTILGNVIYGNYGCETDPVVRPWTTRSRRPCSSDTMDQERILKYRSARDHVASKPYRRRPASDGIHDGGVIR